MTTPVLPDLPGHWKVNATRWLDAAQQGRIEELEDSWGQGFWANWRSKSGNPPIHQLLAQGRDPSILPALLADGLSLDAPAPDHTPLLHRLVTRDAATCQAWAEALRPHIGNWEEQAANQFTLIQEAIRHGKVELVRTLLDWGIPVPASPCPWMLPIKDKTASSCEGLHALFIQHGIRPTRKTTPELFYAALIRAGTPVSRLPWYEAHGFPMPSLPALLHEASPNLRQSGGGWVEELIARGVDPHALHNGQTLRQRVTRNHPDPLMQEGLAAWVDEAIARGLRRRLADSLHTQPDWQEGLPRPRL